MSYDHTRTIARARKALGHAVAAAADAKADHKAARTVKRAERGARHARRSMLEALRYDDGFDYLLNR